MDELICSAHQACGEAWLVITSSGLTLSDIYPNGSEKQLIFGLKLLLVYLWPKEFGDTIPRWQLLAWRCWTKPFIHSCICKYWVEVGLASFLFTWNGNKKKHHHLLKSHGLAGETRAGGALWSHSSMSTLEGEGNEVLCLQRKKTGWLVCWRITLDTVWQSNMFFFFSFWVNLGKSWFFQGDQIHWRAVCFQCYAPVQQK